MIDKVREYCESSDIIKGVLDEVAIEEFIEVNSSRTKGYSPSLVLTEVTARLFSEVRKWSDWEREMSEEERIARNRKFCSFSTLTFPVNELIEIFINSDQNVQHHLYEVVHQRRSARELEVYAGCLKRSGLSIGPIPENKESNWVRDSLAFYEFLKDAIRDAPQSRTYDLSSPEDFIVKGFATRTFEKETWVFKNIREYPRTMILLRVVYGDSVIREFLTKFRYHEGILKPGSILNTLDNWQELSELPSGWIIKLQESEA